MAYQINIANREINPRVINFFTFENQVTTLEFTLDNYIYDEVDLRNYKAYAVTSIKGSVDMTELEMRYDDVDDKLTLTWNVGDYTLTQEGAIIYQITFKQNEDDGENSAVWYSYKSVMINRGTVDADHKIVAEYPTIMKQWLDKMDALEGELIDIKNEAIEEINRIAAMFDASVVYIPYGETIPVEDRLNNRLYYQYTNEEHTNGRLEDCEGTILSETDNVITNCITAIPQRIKYTVENNRLIIQTGSVLIVPYGTEDLTAQYPVGSTFIHENFKVYDTQFADGKFFVWVEVLADLKNKYSGSTSISHVFANINIGSGLTVGDVISNTSGDTDTGTGTYRFWYDTANNLVKKFEDDAVNPISDVFALPLMVAQSEVSVGWKTIDQVFNGFGYIGSTIWADKGVRGLIPNGRHIDGTLKNIEFTTSKVVTQTRTDWSTYNRVFVIEETGVIGTYIKNTVSYDDENNLNVLGGTNRNGCICGEIATVNNIITSFAPKLPFRAADHQDVMLKQDKATAVNYDNITNCITEIPQDIKLELNNGTLTLKAGSKVYVPNGKNADGSNKFDEVTIAFDISFLSGTPRVASAQRMLVYNASNMSFGWNIVSLCKSTSSSEVFTDGGLYYNTNSNIIKVNNTQSSGDRYSLPICLFTAAKTDGVVDSLDQVFNGFGYIGSTVFALPNVKGLTPNGRNEDGSLRNIELKVSSVLLGEGYGYSGKHPFRVTSSGIGVRPNTVSDTQPESTGYQTWYNPVDNFIYRNEGSGTAFKKESAFIAGLVGCTADKSITSLTPKRTFNAVDYSDSSWIAQQAMPSGKYIDLTLGATGSTYTAPANGWFYVAGNLGKGNGNIGLQILNTSAHFGTRDVSYVPSTSVEYGVAQNIYAKKGDKVQINYVGTMISHTFRFIYCEGEK